jgi:hypothetical protein
LFLSRNSKGISIGFFFCRFDEALSLNAETILRSIIRQSLDPTSLSRDIESCLEKISKSPLSGIEELRSLLQKIVASSELNYIIIDALDECEKSERVVLFDIFQSTIASNGSKIKLFLASRESIGGEIENRFRSVEHISMNSTGARADIVTYIRESIDMKLKNGDLVVGNDELIQEIQDALIQGAQGMLVTSTQPSLFHEHR